MEVEDLILVLGSSMSENIKFEGNEELTMYNLLIQNYISVYKGRG